MTIPTSEEMRQAAKEQQAAQDLALMLEQVMMHCPEQDEEWCLARAKLILSAKARVLAAPTGLGGAAKEPGYTSTAKAFESGMRAVLAAQSAVKPANLGGPAAEDK